jgi:cellulose synthase/poly-beta-1,6-N-acetylglucosamine synthase-like glycosyltransferase
MQNKKILLSSLIHNRAWILPQFLEHILALEYDKSIIHLYFVLNNSIDNSFNIIREFQNKYKDEYYGITIMIKNFDRDCNDERLNRHIKNKGMKTYEILKNLRSFVMNIFYEGDYDYLFSVDSDILLNKDDLNLLIESKKDAVAGLICNSEEIKNAYNFLFIHGNSFYRAHDFNIPEDIFEVGLTGAVILFNQNIFSFGKIDYFGDKFTSEDEEFCYKLASKVGTRIFVNPKVTPKHILSKEMLEDGNCSI